jgi:hypothetical protein
MGTRRKRLGEQAADAGAAGRLIVVVIHDWLNRAVDHDAGIQWVRGDPLLRGITADPRCAALLRTLNLTQ